MTGMTTQDRGQQGRDTHATDHRARTALTSGLLVLGLLAAPMPALAQSGGSSDDIATEILRDITGGAAPQPAAPQPDVQIDPQPNVDPATGGDTGFVTVPEPVIGLNPDSDPGLDPNADFTADPAIEPGAGFDPATGLTTGPADPANGGFTNVQSSETGPVVVESSGAVLRGLDKVSGETTDIAFSAGETRQYGYLTVTLRECRYPADDPSSNAYAFVTISEKSDDGKEWFSGWMIANAPALNPLDHPRYDVWPLRCKIDSGSGSGG